MSHGRQQHHSHLTADGISAIHNASLEILERTGVFVQSDSAREMLRGVGAIVDGGRVRIPSYLVDQAVRTAPKRVVLSDRDGKRLMFLEGSRSYFTAINDCPYILDPFIRSKRIFTSNDYRLTGLVVDACSNINGAGCGGNAVDYPPEVRQQAAFKYSMLNMKKPFLSCPLNVEQLEDVYDMAAAIAGGPEKLERAPFVVNTCEPTSPLRLFEEATEMLLLSASRNLPVVWYPVPSAGTTAPASPAAALAIGNAEVLAGLVLHQLKRPGAPFIYGSMPTMTDMRSTQCAYGSPDFSLMVAGNTELAHYYGLPFYGTAGCTDSFEVDQQAAAESSMLCLMALQSGANLIHDTGLLAGAIVVSPEMIVLVDEIIGMVDHATRPICTSQDELAVDLINELAPQGNYLTSDHTLANFRRFWHSGLFLRSRFTGSPEDEPEPLYDRINRRTREIIETHTVEPLPDEVIRELDELENKWMGRVMK